jgi:hypothetical protein
VTSWDYGIVQFSLNGKLVGGRFDTFSRKIDTEAVTIPAVDVTAGQNVLRGEVVGRNPEAAGSFAGLDALVLEPVK